MPKTQEPRTPEKPKRGRPALPPGEKMLSVSYVVSPKQHAKVMRNGGSPYVRRLIDSDKEAI